MLAAVSLPESPVASLPKQAAAPSLRVLMADDEVDMCELVTAALGARGYAVTAKNTPAEALIALDAHEYCALLVDIHMDGMSGLELCRLALEKRPDLPVVVMTGFGTMEHAVGAMRAGAYDFITKPVSVEVMGVTVDRAVQHFVMSKELSRLKERVHAEALPRVIGSSSGVKNVAMMVERVAQGDASVLITGESGTGKELVARAIHERSGRKGPFLAINCAAVPENLLESELFGHVRGAFTDARVSRDGLFVEANGGTLFLDEIGDMPLAMQAKLLRALQEKKVRALGSSRETPFDARVVTATNRNLEAEVAKKGFREDLYYRINVVHIDVPPLRHRGNDILELAQLFLDRAAKRMGKSVTSIARPVAERLLTHDWSGNVRELENCMERAVALTSFDTITLDDLPLRIRESNKATDDELGIDPGNMPTMDTVEMRYIQKVLNATANNKTLAAKILGFDRRTLYRKIKDAS